MKLFVRKELFFSSPDLLLANFMALAWHPTHRKLVPPLDNWVTGSRSSSATWSRLVGVGPRRVNRSNAKCQEWYRCCYEPNSYTAGVLLMPIRAHYHRFSASVCY